MSGSSRDEKETGAPETPTGEAKAPEAATEASIPDTPTRPTRVARAALRTQNPELFKLKVENSNLQRQIQAKKSEVKNSQANLDASRAELAELKNSEGVTNEKLADKKSEYAKLLTPHHNLEDQLKSLQNNLVENLETMNRIILVDEQRILSAQRSYDIDLVVTNTKDSNLTYGYGEDVAQKAKDALIAEVKAPAGEKDRTAIICEQNKTKEHEELVSGTGPKKSDDIAGYQSKPSKFYLYSETKPSEGSKPGEWGLVEMTGLTNEQKLALNKQKLFPSYNQGTTTKHLAPYQINKDHRFLYTLAEQYNPNLQSPEQQNHPGNVRMLDTVIASSNNCLPEDGQYKKKLNLHLGEQSGLSPRAPGPRGDDPNAHTHAGNPPPLLRSPTLKGIFINPIRDTYQNARQSISERSSRNFLSNNEENQSPKKSPKPSSSNT